MGSSSSTSAELPQDVIHHILSFLATKDATRTSILSKAWLNAWGTRPTLYFDYTFMTLFEKWASKGYGDHPKEKHTAPFQYIISTLERYRDQKIGLEVLKLEDPSSSGRSPYVDRCMELAVQCGVRNLQLWMGYCTLPSSVFEIKPLVELSLRQSCFKNGANILCYDLKRLFLWDVDLHGEEMFENIIRSCPLIEILKIFNCRGIPKNFKGINLHNLKQLNAKLLAGQCVGVEAAPNLETLTCRTSDDLRGHRKSPSWINLRASQYRNLRSLLLYGMRMEDDCFGNFAYKFPHLQDLSIQRCQLLQRVEISSHSLKEIQLVRNNRLKEAQFDVPNIGLFEYEDENETIPKLSFTDASGRWASEIKLICNRNVDTSWFLNLKEFLMKLNQSEVCLTVCFSGDVAFDEDEIANNATFPEVEEIREFCLKGVQKFSSSTALAIMDGVFWTCHPRTITHWHWLDYRFTEQLYEMLIPRSSDHHPNHSNSKKISKFWQRNLKDLKDIKIFRNRISSVKGGRIDHFKAGRGLQMPKDLNWKNFQEILETQAEKGRTIVGFNLEWKTCYMPRQANKRLKTVEVFGLGGTYN